VPLKSENCQKYFLSQLRPLEIFTKTTTGVKIESVNESNERSNEDVDKIKKIVMKV
jgi:hypothetical protein